MVQLEPRMMQLVVLWRTWYDQVLQNSVDFTNGVVGTQNGTLGSSMAHLAMQWHSWEGSVAERESYGFSGFSLALGSTQVRYDSVECTLC